MGLPPTITLLPEPLQLPSSLLAKIKACRPLLSVIRTLKEGNLEFLAVDSRTVVTDHPEAAVGKVVVV
jgi:hypothetical protein